MPLQRAREARRTFQYVRQGLWQWFQTFSALIHETELLWLKQERPKAVYTPNLSLHCGVPKGTSGGP